MAIPFAEFQKLDLRIAEVKEVNDHPNADKLYVLNVDMGTETRQLVAALKPYMPPEKLLGKKIVVVANLEPATLRGVESKGMLLAVQHGDRVTVLVPDEDVPPGSTVT
jgi:methionyl-tRNA synthetase